MSTYSIPGTVPSICINEFMLHNTLLGIYIFSFFSIENNLPKVSHLVQGEENLHIGSLAPETLFVIITSLLLPKKKKKKNWKCAERHLAFDAFIYINLCRTLNNTVE